MSGRICLPALPTPRGRAAPGMLAHLLVSKYTDHLPLYRQSEIMPREGVDLDRSTSSDWVGQAVWRLQPIVEGIHSCSGFAIIGGRARNHRRFGLTLGEIIGRVWLTLSDPRLTIIETDLQSSAPGSRLVRRSFAIGGAGKDPMRVDGSLSW